MDMKEIMSFGKGLFSKTFNIFEIYQNHAQLLCDGAAATAAHRLQ